MSNAKVRFRIFMLTFIFLFKINLFSQNGSFVETNGVKIYYETYGNGDPLLLLHGFTLSHRAWEVWIEDLSKDYKLIIPDLRGHGYSTNPSNIYRHELSAKDMYGVMDHLNIKKFKAIGQSSGAMTLIHMATQDTSRITAMILIASTSYLTEEGRRIQRRVSYETLDNNWLRNLKKHQPGGEKQIRLLLDQFRNFAEGYDDMNFTPPYLATIKCPTFIIHGDRDPFFPVDIPVSSYKAIPNSYLWIVPNDRHIPIGIYDRNSIWSEVFYKAALEFLSGKWQ